MKSKVAVIIPFFQEKSGILRNAVTSVLNQKGIDSIEIIVVDDGSPVPATTELAPLMQVDGRVIKIIRQDNAGAGAARNTGLDKVSTDTEYVALLDSDDHWAESHLTRALSALERGYGLYFGNARFLNTNTTAFDISRMKKLEHVEITGLKSVYRYVGNLFSEVILRTGADAPYRPRPFNPSTIVYRYQNLCGIRFEEDLAPCEDDLFLLELLSRSTEVCFSTAPECLIGEGVNIFRSSDWGSERMLWREYNRLRLRKRISEKFQLCHKDRMLNKMSMNDIRRSFVTALIHDIAKGRIGSLSYFFRFMRVDPIIFFYFVIIFPRVLILRFRKLFAPS